MRTSCCVVAALAAGLWSAVASAATVKPMKGSVSINAGRPVSTATTVKVGDTVTAGPGGPATIRYANGCSVTVEPGTTVTVVPDDLCTVGLAGDPGVTALAVGAGVVAAGAVALAVAAARNPASP